MYARYTEFEFDPAARDAALRFWEAIALPSASRQPGWRAAYVLESEEHAGRLRTVTLWEEETDFERYRTSEDHALLGAGIQESGLRIVDREGLRVREAATSTGPLLRVTRAHIPAERSADVAAYWRDTGGPMMRRALGCRRAEAFLDGEGQGFTVLAEWASEEHARTFLESPEHGAFAAAMDKLGSVVQERITGRHIR